MSGLRAGGKRIHELFKEGWIKIPEVMASHVMSTIGLIGFGLMHLYARNRTFTPRIFDEPLYMRPDDPRAPKTLTWYEEGWDKKQK